MSNGWKEEFCDIPWLADEQTQHLVLPSYATSLSGLGQLWRQTSMTVKRRSKLARGLEKASKAACIKSQTEQSTNVNSNVTHQEIHHLRGALGKACWQTKQGRQEWLYLTAALLSYWFHSWTSSALVPDSSTSIDC